MSEKYLIYKLQEIAKKIVSENKKTSKITRIEHCNKTPIKKIKGDFSSIFDNSDYSKLNLQTCKKWICPLCANKMAYHHAKKINNNIDLHLKNIKNSIIYMTIKPPYKYDIKLINAIKLQDLSMSFLKTQNSVKNITFKNIMNCIKLKKMITIKNIEYSYKKEFNLCGWKPSIEIIMLCKEQNEDSINKIKKNLTELYAKSYRKRGGKIPNIGLFRNECINLSQYKNNIIDNLSIGDFFINNLIDYNTHNDNLKPFAMLNKIHNKHKDSNKFKKLFEEFSQIKNLHRIF